MSAGTPQTVGAIVPTFNRPDLLRSCVLQLGTQSRPPDIICIHQNGHPDSYAWAVADLRLPSRIVYLHSPERLRQHDWYAVPLRQLLDAGCTHFFWADHDDLYLHEHVASGLAQLADCDFVVSRRVGLLFTRPADWRYGAEVDFTSHAPGGMSASMCFNRAFAQQLLQDLLDDREHQYADNVVAHVTMPRFRCAVSTQRTCIYHAHEGSLTARGWLPRVFGPDPAAS